MHGNNVEEAIGAGKLAAPRSESISISSPLGEMPPVSSSENFSISSGSIPRKPVADSTTGSIAGSSLNGKPVIPGAYPSDISKTEGARIETPMTPPYLDEPKAPTISFHSSDDVSFLGSSDHGDDTHKIAVEIPSAPLTPPSEKETIQHSDADEKEETPPESAPQDVQEIPETTEDPQEPVDNDPVISEWNFTLPRITPPKSFVPGGRFGMEEFSMRDVIGAIQNGVEYQKIQDYLHFFDRSKISKLINGEVSRFPTIFYAGKMTFTYKANPGLIQQLLQLNEMTKRF